MALPGLAAVLALLPDVSVHASYITLQLAFLFVGSYWLTQYVQECGLDASFGFAVFLIPTSCLWIE